MSFRNKGHSSFCQVVLSQRDINTNLVLVLCIFAEFEIHFVLFDGGDLNSSQYKQKAIDFSESLLSDLLAQYAMYVNGGKMIRNSHYSSASTVLHEKLHFSPSSTR